LIVSPEDAFQKYEQTGSLKILFLSNAMVEKGVLLLIRTVTSLNERCPEEHIQLAIVGEPESLAVAETLDHYRNERQGVRYFGAVHGPARRRFYEEAHVFCLPTWYRYEGQPISILEAYANACAVITTNQGGINDIFEEPSRGFLVEQQSQTSLEGAILRARRSLSAGDLVRIGKTNREYALKAFDKTAALRRLTAVICNSN